MVQAGTISSIPYAVSSLAVPFIGGMISYFGEQYFEFMLFSTVATVLSVHLFYLALSDVTEEGKVGEWYTFLPIAVFGMAHAIFSSV